jgi:digeranylgeranylglycerophospholipid reductase
MKYDAVVVGGGPAGSSAAAVLARGGAKVLLLEKRQEIGTPVRCAEGVSKGGLKKCGIKPNPKWIAAEMKGARLHSPDDTVVELSAELAGNEVGYILERKIFDRELVAEAADAGAEIRVKTAATSLIKREGRIKGVVIFSDGEKKECETSLVIGADGVESLVGRWAGLSRQLKLKDVESCVQYLMTGIECDPEFSDFFIGRCYSPGGYVWVFPKGNRKANVGIGVLGSMIPLKSRGFAKKLLDEFISKHKEYSRGSIIEMFAGSVPVSGPLKKTISNNLMLVGDAAGHSDPATGGGIINAILGGQIAGRVGINAIEQGDYSEAILSRYEEEWKEAFGNSLETNLLIKDILVSLNDRNFDDLADSLKGYNFSELSLGGLIEAIQETHPELLDLISDL